MEGYDINRIKFKSKNEPSVEEKLTGKVITGLENLNKVRPNAELEGKEYIQFPDGTTQLVAGNSHAKGGVKMNIPDGAKVASNSLTLSSPQAKQLKDEYGINVSPKDTYASAITKYIKKIGLEDLYNEEEELYKLVSKELEKTDVDESTRLVNQEYLSGKTRELQLKKEEKEKAKSEFFGIVFDIQEGSKSESKMNKSKNGELKYGGLSEQNFKEICKKHGISEEQGRVLLGEKMPSFEDGGEFDVLRKKYNTAEKVDLALEDGTITNDQYQQLMSELKKQNGVIFTTESGAGTYSDEATYLREKQKKSDAAFGKIGTGDMEDVMWNYYKNFPEAAKKHLGVKVADGKISWDKSIDFTKENEKVRAFQKDANKIMVASDNSILSEDASGLFSGEFQDLAKSHLENETFIDDKKNIRGFDGKVGNFTSGRYVNKVNVLTPEEITKLEGMHIYTLSQAEEALKKDPSLLSDNTQDRIKKLRDVSKEGADFRLNVYDTPDAPKPEVKTEPTPDGPIDNNPVAVPKGYFPQLFGGPNEYPTAPYPMDPHLLGESRFQRMDPIRIGIEPQIQEAGDQRKFLAEQLFGNLSPNVAASVMASSMANQTKAINAEARAANITNAQNLANTELFNIGQAGKESEANLRNKLSFEQRQYMAKSNFQEEMKRWEDQIRRININKYKNNQALNLMNQMFPDFNVGYGGNTVNYDPQSQFQIQDMQKFLQTMGYDPLTQNT